MKYIEFCNTMYYVPDWVKWVAMAIDGEIHGFESKPLSYQGYYYKSSSGERSAHIGYGSLCVEIK